MSGGEHPPKTERRRRDSRPISLGPTHPCLQILEGASAGLLIRLGSQPVLWGRSPECQLRSEDVAISWKHAIIRREGEDVFLEDLASTNGTFVDGQPLQGTILLHQGALVSLAQVVSFRMDRLNESEIGLAERLYRNATRDALTGLLNRVSFFTQAEQEMALFERSGRGFGLLMIDLDFFKRVNDSLGHPAGDELLAQLARLLRQHLRLEDLLARVGGEEFCVLLRSTDAKGCLEVAERLRGEVAASSFRLLTPRGTIEHRATLSIGAAYSQPKDTLGDLVDRADQALYQAKNHGRNQVCGL